MRVVSTLALCLVLAFGLAACENEPDAIDDLNDASFELVNHEGETVVVPDDLKGNVVVMGYIYTSCPDYCQLLMANMRNAYEELDAPDNVQFVSVSFDPERDTPEVMNDYREAYRADGAEWEFLTGDPETIDAFMDRMNIHYEISDTLDSDPENYLINHTDAITLIDNEGRVRDYMNGSRTPVDMLVEDINALREEV